MNLSKERRFVNLLALGVAPVTAAKAVGYGQNESYRWALIRLAKRDLGWRPKLFKPEQQEGYEKA